MNEIDENDLQVFIDGALHYFTQVSDESAEVRIPYLIKEDLVMDEYTGTIGISGIRKGMIYFSAPRAMLRHILLSLGENANTDELYSDLVGEIANIISGNARRKLGSDFNISVPEVVRDEIIHLMEKKVHQFAIPIRWKFYTSSLVIRLH
jgi:chemotaxis protein CheX